MSDFARGDVVVCVSLVSPCECGGLNRTMTSCWVGMRFFQAPVLRATYRVDAIHMGYCMACRRPAPAFTPTSPALGGFASPQACFKRIERADVDLFRLADAPVPPELVDA